MEEEILKAEMLSSIKGLCVQVMFDVKQLPLVVIIVSCKLLLVR